MRLRHICGVLLIALLGFTLATGCDFFTGGAVTPLVVLLSVNGQAWTGGSEIEVRPDYARGAVMVTVEVAGGDPNARYCLDYMDGTTSRQKWFDPVDGDLAAATVELAVNQTFVVRSGRADPVSYTLTIVNHEPVLHSAWLSDKQPEMGAHIRCSMAYYEWGTCVSSGTEFITGAYDEDAEAGDTLTYRLRVTGPKKASWEDRVSYRLYNDLPGTNEYEIVTDEWFPIETQLDFFVGYDGTSPAIGALGCYPDPDVPFNQDDSWPSGANLCVEAWVKDSLGATVYGKWYWEIYIAGCP